MANMEDDDENDDEEDGDNDDEEEEEEDAPLLPSLELLPALAAGALYLKINHIQKRSVLIHTRHCIHT
jgi:hypothetical protein